MPRYCVYRTDKVVVRFSMEALTPEEAAEKARTMRENEGYGFAYIQDSIKVCGMNSAGVVITEPVLYTWERQEPAQLPRRGGEGGGGS